MALRVTPEAADPGGTHPETTCLGIIFFCLQGSVWRSERRKEAKRHFG